MEREIFNHRATAVSLGSEARAGGPGKQPLFLQGARDIPNSKRTVRPESRSSPGVEENLGPHFWRTRDGGGNRKSANESSKPRVR